MEVTDELQRRAHRYMEERPWYDPGRDQEVARREVLRRDPALFATLHPPRTEHECRNFIQWVVESIAHGDPQRFDSLRDIKDLIPLALQQIAQFDPSIIARAGYGSPRRRE